MYVHVPFCLSKCRYCDFYSVPMDRGLAGRYVRAVSAELESYLGCLVRPLASIFVGGGTPSALGLEGLAGLLGPLTELAGPGTEFSVEANPADISAELADTLARAGVNRVSLGAQSYQPSELALLGRRHGSGQIDAALAVLRLAGIDNLGLDLIYGLPGQSLTSWQESLSAALATGIDHLSCYGLSIEAGTPLARSIQTGELTEMDEELQRQCYYAARDAADRAGMEHYEISNFAKPARRCLHNLTYWHNGAYLGIGPAAASFLGATRRTNCADLDNYLRAINAGQPAPSTSETLMSRKSMAETLMLGLRLIDGVDRRSFAARFGLDPLDAFGQSISRYRDIGALTVSDSHIALSPDYLFTSDTILADILAEA